MSMLIVQTIVKQWDKSQQSEQHQQQRMCLPDRYPLHIPPAEWVIENQVLLEQRGDDIEGKRIQYLVHDKDDFIIDRFRFSLPNKTLEYQTAHSEPVLISQLTEGWVQCRYNWRRRVEQGGFIYWLYEDVTLNACFVEKLDSQIFMISEPETVFTDLTLPEQ